MDTKQIIKDLSDLRIKGRHRVWEPFLTKYNCKRVCEVGVCDGANFRDFITDDMEIAVGVDSWIDDGVISRNDGGYTQEKLDTQYNDFIEEHKDRPFVKTLRVYSIDAVKKFEDNYFDLIYIDADHTYNGCKRDIEDWYLKVRLGGFLIGDDYRRKYITRTNVVFGVVQAVNEFAEENNLEFFELPHHGWGIIKPYQ